MGRHAPVVRVAHVVHERVSARKICVQWAGIFKRKICVYSVLVFRHVIYVSSVVVSGT